MVDKKAENAFIDALKAEEQIPVKILMKKDEKGENFVPVSINGYIYQVKKGETVKVPKTVAGILENAGYI